MGPPTLALLTGTRIHVLGILSHRVVPHGNRRPALTHRSSTPTVLWYRSSVNPGARLRLCEPLIGNIKQGTVHEQVQQPEHNSHNSQQLPVHFSWRIRRPRARQKKRPCQPTQENKTRKEEGLLQSKDRSIVTSPKQARVDESQFY